MPEIVIRDHKIETIKEGHTLFGSTVTRVTVGTKWVTVWLNPPMDGKTRWAFELGTPMEIGKLEPTADELIEKAIADQEVERDYFVHWVDKQTASVQGTIEKAIEAIKPDWVRYSEIDALLYADAYTRIYGQMADFMERAREQKLHKAHVDGGECDYTEKTEDGYRCVKPTVETTAYDGARICVEWLADQLASRAANFRASSRSTSIMSNYMEDVYLEALGKVARDMRYAVGSELRDVLPKSW